MDKVRFDNTYEFVDDIMAIYCDDCQEISIFVNSEDATEIVRELIGQDYICDEMFRIECLNIDPYDYEVALITIDEKGGIWAENAMGKDRFKIVDNGIIYTEPKYYDDVVAANGTDDIEYTVFTIGEEEEVPEKKKVTILTDDDKKISGFRYEDKKDGECFSVEFCNCAPVEDIDGMLTMCEKILDAYAKFLC